MPAGAHQYKSSLSTCRPYSCKITLGFDEGFLDLVPFQTSFSRFIPCKVLTKSRFSHLLLPSSQIPSCPGLFGIHRNTRNETIILGKPSTKNNKRQLAIGIRFAILVITQAKLLANDVASGAAEMNRLHAN